MPRANLFHLKVILLAVAMPLMARADINPRLWVDVDVKVTEWSTVCDEIHELYLGALRGDAGTLVAYPPLAKDVRLSIKAFGEYSTGCKKYALSVKHLYKKEIRDRVLPIVADVNRITNEITSMQRAGQADLSQAKAAKLKKDVAFAYTQINLRIGELIKKIETKEGGELKGGYKKNAVDEQVRLKWDRDRIQNLHSGEQGKPEYRQFERAGGQYISRLGFAVNEDRFFGEYQKKMDATRDALQALREGIGRYITQLNAEANAGEIRQTNTGAVEGTEGSLFILAP